MTRIAVIAFFALPSILMADAQPVKITAADGFTLAGTLWQDDEADPAVLMLHQCNADRTMYDELGEKLAAAGFRALSVDYRGYGESTDETYDLEKSSSDEDRVRGREKRPADVEAAYQYLASQGGGDVVGTIGASCGGGEQVTLAGKHPEIERLVFFSSGLSQTQLRDALQLQARTMLLITSKGDTRAGSTAGTLAYRYGKSNTELLLYDGDSHGHPLFAEHPDLVDRMVTYFADGPK